MSQKLLFIVGLVFSFNLIAQDELIKKVFSTRNQDFQSKVKIIDTLSTAYIQYDEYESYGAEIPFGMSDFERFLIYEYDNSGKVGLIIYGDKNSFFTDPIADSIRFAMTKEFGYEEGYKDNGDYFAHSTALSIYFVFEQNEKADEAWEIGIKSDKYYAIKSGDLKKDIFRLVRLNEVDGEEYPNQFAGAFVNLQTNEIVESTVFNEKILALEAYSYEPDYYYDGYYGEYYGEEEYASETSSASPIIESGLNYMPINVEYISDESGVSELISYSYLTIAPNSYYKRTATPEFSGVWKSKEKSETIDELVIIDGDDISNAFRVFTARIDEFEGLYEVSKLDWEEAMARIPLTTQGISTLEKNWVGSKSNLRFISTVGWISLEKFKEYYIANDENLVHIALIAKPDNTIEITIDFYAPEKTYNVVVKGRYDELLYTPIFIDKENKVYDLQSRGLYDFYEYGMAAAKRNIDEEGNLVLTNEYFGNVSFKTHSYGNEYVGTYLLSWIGSPYFDETATVTSLTAQPYKILDEKRNVLADNIAYVAVDNALGFNIYQIYNTDFKVGILGPDGSWLVKQAYDQISVSGPTSSYYYEAASFPLFFIVNEKDKYGLINAQGKELLPVKYESIEICSNEIITVLNGKMGLHSFSGEMILPNEYVVAGYYGYATDCYSFYGYGGTNKILEKNGRVGMINDKYEVVIPFEYLSLMPTDNTSNYIAENADGGYGIISEKNEIIVGFDYENIEYFDYVPNRYIVTKNDRQGVIDSKGNILIPTEHYAIHTNSDWNTNVITVYNEDYLTKVIDTTGRVILDNGCAYLFYYPEAEVFYCSHDYDFAFYDRNGNFLYTKVAEYIDPYDSYGNIQVCNFGTYEKPKVGAFDLNTGQIVIEPNATTLYPFWIGDDVFFYSQTKKKITIIDANGKAILKTKGAYMDNYFYDYAEDDNYHYFVEISNKNGESKIIQLPGY